MKLKKRTKTLFKAASVIALQAGLAALINNSDASALEELLLNSGRFTPAQASYAAKAKGAATASSIDLEKIVSRAAKIKAIEEVAPEEARDIASTAIASGQKLSTVTILKAETIARKPAINNIILTDFALPPEENTLSKQQAVAALLSRGVARADITADMVRNTEATLAKDDLSEAGGLIAAYAARRDYTDADNKAAINAFLKGGVDTPTQHDIDAWKAAADADKATIVKIARVGSNVADPADVAAAQALTAADIDFTKKMIDVYKATAPADQPTIIEAIKALTGVGFSAELIDDATIRQYNAAADKDIAKQTFRDGLTAARTSFLTAGVPREYINAVAIEAWKKAAAAAAPLNPEEEKQQVVNAVKAFAAAGVNATSDEITGWTGNSPEERAKLVKIAQLAQNSAIYGFGVIDRSAIADNLEAYTALTASGVNVTPTTINSLKVDLAAGNDGSNVITAAKLLQDKKALVTEERINALLTEIVAGNPTEPVLAHIKYGRL
jgi:predicted DNA-binding protein (UPF0251 family)